MLITLLLFFICSRVRREKITNARVRRNPYVNGSPSLALGIAPATDLNIVNDKQSSIV